MLNLLEVKKLERVVKSSLAAETQALAEGAEFCSYVADILKLLIKDTVVKINCYTDCKSLVDSLSSLKKMEPCMKQETFVIRDMLDRGVIEPVTWIPSKDQLADVLTKRGVCTRKIMETLSRD